jgi:hypothetical protein
MRHYLPDTSLSIAALMFPLVTRCAYARSFGIVEGDKENWDFLRARLA